MMQLFRLRGGWKRVKDQDARSGLASPDPASATPLPWPEILFISIIHVGQALQTTMLLPILVFMVRSYGVAGGTDHNIGRYTGLLAALYPLGQFCSCIFWGRVSDSTGRKVWLVFGNAVTGVSAAVLGLAHSYRTACVARFVNGLLNCTLLITKSTLAELCDKLFHLPECPAVFARYPFILPFAVMALLSLVGLGCSFLLPETLPREGCWFFAGSTRKYAELPGLEQPGEEEGEGEEVGGEEEGGEYGGGDERERRRGRFPRSTGGGEQGGGKSSLQMSVLRVDGPLTLAADPGDATWQARWHAMWHKEDRLGEADLLEVEEGRGGRWLKEPVRGGEDSTPPVPGLERVAPVTAAHREPQSSAGLEERRKEGETQVQQMAGARVPPPATGNSSRRCGDRAGRGPGGTDTDIDADTGGKRAYVDSDSRTGRPDVAIDLVAVWSLLLRERGVVLAVSVYSLMSLTFLYAEELFPIFASAPASLGGLSFTSSSIGVITGTAGAAMTLHMLLGYPALVRRMGPLWCLRAGLALLVPVVLATPVSSYLRAPAPALMWALLLASQGARAVAQSTAFTGIMVINCNSAAPGTLGAVTGAGQSMSFLFRALAPACAGLVWSHAARLGLPFYQVAVWALDGAVTLLALYIALLLPQSLDSPREGPAVRTSPRR
eukprot:jgi/Mesen1/5885/ME000299S04995